MNPGYLLRVDRLNIVGYDKPWHESAAVDRAASATPVLCAQSRRAWFCQPDARQRRCTRAQGPGRRGGALGTAGAIAETGSGDSALIVDDDPVAMAQAARHLMDDVYMATATRACASRCTTATVATRARDKEPGSSHRRR